jgi:hypothetical protein
MSSKQCLQCGFVSFARADACKRCGADLPASRGSAPPPPPPLQPTEKKRSPFLVYLVVGLVTLALGAFAFGATADHGIALPLTLFTVIFIGGMVLAVIIGTRLKASEKVETQPASPTGKKYLSVVVYMFASLVLLLPPFLLKLDSNLPSEVMMEKVGELVGACLVPAIITALWMRFSKQGWPRSASGVGLRYLLLFLIFGFSVVLRMMLAK